MDKRTILVVVLIQLLLLAACAGEPEIVEVTRVVEQEVPATVEVTRVVTETAVIEVPVEVTRLVEVEVVVTMTPDPTETAAAEATATPDGSNYTVQSGDTLPLIASKTGANANDILEANNLTAGTSLVVGQELFIPEWDGVERVAETTSTPAATATSPPVSTAELVTHGPNLFPNPSFEGDWYFHQFNELQIPVGWQVVTDEGPNTLTPGSGGNFLRPEIRVIPESDLPPAERSLFIFDGMKTVKAFKGGAPTSFSLFTDVTLQPGTYRLTVRFFSDVVAGYQGGQKQFATDSLAGEVRLIHNNGGTDWQGTQIGQRNTRTYDFTVTQTSTVRLGASFRNRYIMDNNGWFIDHWSLQELTVP